MESLLRLILKSCQSILWSGQRHSAGLAATADESNLQEEKEKEDNNHYDDKKKTTATTKKKNIIDPEPIIDAMNSKDNVEMQRMENPMHSIHK